MEVKKAIKKIVALGVGATMLGTTILGAMALDLSNYPEPFVKNGMFDGLIVIGEKAQGMDVVGAVDIGTSIQYAVRQETTTAVTTTTATVAQGTKIEKSGKIMTLGDDIYDIRDTALDETFLPTVLAQGTFTETKGETDNEDIDYDQSLQFPDGNAQIVYEAEKQTDEEIAADYLKINDDKILYTYRLKFGSSVEYKNDTTSCKSSDSTADNDLESAVIQIQGNTYTITGAECKGAGNALSKLTMMAGETTLWLTQDQVVTKTVGGKEHTIQVSDVTDSETSCGVLVDGTLVWIDKGSSETINGVRIGVLDAKAVHSQLQDQDICQLNIGSRKVEMENGQKIKIDGVDVDNAYVYFEGSSAGKLDAIVINYTANDDVWIKAGDSWIDPALGNWKLVYGGLSGATEEIKITTSASSGKITFTNADNQKIEVPFARDNNKTNIRPGDDYTKRKLVAEGTVNLDCEDGSTDKDDCEGALLWVISGGVPHLMKITDIFEENNQNKTKIKDVVSGNEYTSDGFTWAVDENIALGSIGTITINLTVDGNISASNLQLDDDKPAETKYGMQIYLPYYNGTHYVTPAFDAATGNILPESGYNQTVRFREEDWDNNKLKAGRVGFNVSFKLDSDKDVVVDLSARYNDNTGNWSADGIAPSDADNDHLVYVSKAGTKIVKDTENNNNIVITYPDNGLTANVYIAPVTATVTTLTTSGVPVYLQKINVGSAKLDSEISSISAQNLIVVGGPCANKVAAELMKVDYATGNCAKDFTAGKAMIKLFETGSGKYAILVAGMTADDTRAATRVLAQPDKYKMSGNEVEVTYTDLSDIKVSAPKTE